MTARWPRLETGFGENAGGLLVDGGEIDRCRGAVGEQALDKFRIDGRRKGLVAVVGFQRKRVLLQPGFQRHIERPAELRPLRRMEVQVDKSGEQQPPGFKCHQRAVSFCPFKSSIVAGETESQHIGNHAVGVDGDQRVFGAIDRAGNRRVNECCPECFAAKVLHAGGRPSVRRY